jgi:hypothetical protein
MFADSGQPSQAASQNFLEIPNPRVTTTSGRLEVTDVRSQTVTGKMLDDRDNPILEGGRPIYVCLRKADLLDPIESAHMMSWWQLRDQALTECATLKKYSLESLINRLDGLNWDELYALRTFVCLESDPFKAYSGSTNSDLSHLQVWFPTVRALDRVEQNQLASALCTCIVVSQSYNPSEAPSRGDRRDDRFPS